MKKQNILAIIQARVDSVRFPGKVLKKVKKLSIIEILHKRLSKSKMISKIVVAIPSDKSNQKLGLFLKNKKIKVFKGNKGNVLHRYYSAAKKFDADIIIRITGDCPLVDANLVDHAINIYQTKKCDYVSNTILPTFPDGLDVEVFSFKALKLANKLAKTQDDKEHVTTYIKNSKKFQKINFKHTKDYSKENWTIDEQVDYDFFKKIIEFYSPNIYFSWLNLYKQIKKNKYLKNKNSIKIRDEGFRMQSGQKLWRRAKTIIPGGNMFLSKREDRILPNFWPNYYSKAKGCYVWDLDGKKYTDMSLMGVGTNILGYSNAKVDNFVIDNIKKGNMSSLNCPEEVLLSEKLLELHPWFQMVKLTRTGGEANAVAVRIARAASKNKHKVAICGYHGWHDWYVAANLKNKKNLNSHLLSGIDSLGIPKKLRDTIFTFEYNRIDQLKKIISQNPDIGIIKMEVSRNELPKNNFLKKIRQIATKKNIILIFDECTSGFRETLGGLHKKYKVYPDIAIFGKALGNGYAINAILGKKEIMRFAEKTFISSTFWSERSGPSAALKTLEIMEKTKSWKLITKKGIYIRNKWKKMAKKYNLKISISGLPALSTFNIKSKQNIAYKTLITQEMLKSGYLASNSIYLCVNHTKEIIDKYLMNLNRIFKTIKDCEKNNNILNYLDGPVCKTHFKRLN
jgi:glutamate-1-semialdehyde 2,1-aminomutase